MAHHTVQDTLYKCSRSIIVRTGHLLLLKKMFSNKCKKIVMCRELLSLPKLNLQTAPNVAQHCPRTSCWCPNNTISLIGNCWPVEHLEIDKNVIFCNKCKHIYRHHPLKLTVIWQYFNNKCDIPTPKLNI